MGERTRTRALVVSRALAARLAAGAPRGEVRRVLVAHNLLLGDTLMLTPLLAKLRERHPQAQITLLASPAFVPLYQQRPYGVRALPFTPSHSATTRALLEESPFGYEERLDEEMPLDQTSIDQAGFNGFLLERFRRFYKDGKVVKTNKWQVRYKPVTEYIRRGTNPDPLAKMPVVKPSHGPKMPKSDTFSMGQ